MRGIHYLFRDDHIENGQLDKLVALTERFGKYYIVFSTTDSVRVGDFVNAKAIINLINTDYSLVYPSLELAKCRLYGIIDSALNALGMLRNEVDESTRSRAFNRCERVTRGKYIQSHIGQGNAI